MTTDRNRSQLVVNMLLSAMMLGLACRAPWPSQPPGASSTSLSPSPTSTDLSPASRLVFVGPQLLTCPVGTCLQIYDPASGEYWADQPDLHGLVYEPGFVWHVAVQPADSPSPSAWTVAKVVSQERAAGTISVTAPILGDAFRSGDVLRGDVSVPPDSGQLLYRVYDAGGTLIGQGPIPVTPAAAGPSPFESVVQFSDYVGPGRIEILDPYTAAGFVGESASVDLYLGMAQPLEIEAFGTCSRVEEHQHRLARPLLGLATDL